MIHSSWLARLVPTGTREVSTHEDEGSMTVTCEAGPVVIDLAYCPPWVHRLHLCLFHTDGRVKVGGVGAPNFSIRLDCLPRLGQLIAQDFDGRLTVIGSQVTYEAVREEMESRDVQPGWKIWASRSKSLTVVALNARIYGRSVGDLRLQDSIGRWDSSPKSLSISSWVRLPESAHAARLETFHAVSVPYERRENEPSYPSLKASYLRIDKIDKELRIALEHDPTSESATLSLDGINEPISIHGYSGAKNLAVLVGNCEKRVTIGGPVEVRLSPVCTVSELVSEYQSFYRAGSPLSDRPQLSAGRAAVIERLAGHWRLGQIGESTIYGPSPRASARLSHRAEFQIFTVLEVADTGALRDAVLSHVSVDPFRGNSPALWRAMKEAAYVQPVLDDDLLSLFTLRGTISRWWQRRIRRLELSPEDVFDDLPFEHRQPSHLLAVIQAIADVANQNGADGATRSICNWVNYRAAELTTMSRAERWLLRLYRLIGYGERPIPAFATWIVGVMGATAWQLRSVDLSLSMATIGDIWKSLSFWAVPSFGLINLPELPVGVNRDVNTFLIHALLAVPFITGILALRNYVKHGNR